MSLHQHLLDHVRRVEAAGQAAVETDDDHLPQPAAVMGQQLLPGGIISSGGTVQQGVRVLWAGGHR
jgi:phage baseplate assembly protein gpV